MRSRIVGPRTSGDAVQTIHVKAVDADSLDRVQEDVSNLREQHRIRPGDNDDFQTRARRLAAAAPPWAGPLALRFSMLLVGLVFAPIPLWRGPSRPDRGATPRIKRRFPTQPLPRFVG
jgi:hypothetical protein